MQPRAGLLQFPRVLPGELPLRLVVLITVLCCAGGSARAEAPQETAAEDLPSAALLEFLGEIDPVDEATWQLLEQHALRDAAQSKEVNSE